MTCADLQPTTHPAIDQALRDLRSGAASLVSCSLSKRIELTRECLARVAKWAKPWVEAGCRAKQSVTAAGRAEEVLTGPIATLRFLHLMARTLEDLNAGRRPRLPKAPHFVASQLRVPVFPTRSFFDALVFLGLSAETWLEPGVSIEDMFGDSVSRLTRKWQSSPRVELVLGAGNVSSIPITDALTKILQDDTTVLLKMNPVNQYLGPIFEDAFQPLVAAGWLRIVYGGGAEGHYAVHHASVDGVHMTGSTETHDAIVWGSDAAERQMRRANRQPLVTKPVTSELGNVTPWIIVPGQYTPRQLRAQAECLVASIVNNASFNCIATKMLITWKHWPQAPEFLDLVDSILRTTPTRFAYYPGAIQRFTEFSGAAPANDPQDHLPWTLRRDVRPEETPILFQRESFVCVAGQYTLDAPSPTGFVQRAVDFANDQMTGTLAANLTVPSSWSRKPGSDIDVALQRLRYGTIGVNQWAGVSFALMSPPWGGYPGATLQDVQSGIGSVHNTYLLDRPQKTILRGPLALWPQPVWYSTHPCPDEVAWRLCAFYSQPSMWRLGRLLAAAV